MLTEAEKHGISELLSRLSVTDLQSLAQTVTSKMLVPETSAEAISAIILHTDRAVDLLKRKKIKKEVLFKYLHFKRVSIEAVSDKSVHVARVLEVWGAAETGDMTVIDDNSLDTPPAPVPSRNTSHTSLCSLDLSVSRDVLYNRGLELRRSGSSTSIMNCDENSCSSFSFSEQSNEAAASLTEVQCQEMAVSFVRWFYHLLNTSVESDCPDWNSSHFWPDASARVSVVSQGEVRECLEVNNNSEETCRMLVNVFRSHKLKCNPNLCQEGVRGKLSPHGLVMVLACGTLHNQNNVCGVFEQVEQNTSHMLGFMRNVSGVWLDPRSRSREQLEDKTDRGEAGWRSGGDCAKHQHLQAGGCNLLLNIETIVGCELFDFCDISMNEYFQTESGDGRG